ncbi:unnamed protein product [Lasius platythorax]|uniref:Uncharacterized protein n=1 Tax=Lasius platythorax TaxID=488582 RepID=A0AAV2NBE1_9HYME
MLKPDYNCVKKLVDREEVSQYEVGQAVLVRVAGKKDIKWWPGETLARKSAVTYLVWANGRERFIHAGEIKKNLTELRAAKNGIDTRPVLDHSRLHDKPFAAALLNSQSDNNNELDSPRMRRPESYPKHMEEAQPEDHQQNQQDREKNPIRERHDFIDPSQVRRSQRTVKKSERLNL